MATPNDRVYADSHEWHKVDGDTLTVGLTQFAVDQLTDVTYVEMKEPGTAIDSGDTLGEVESVKTTSDVYCAASGVILEVNEDLAENPGLLNSDPYEAGWLVKLKLTDPSGIKSLMNQAAYDEKYPD